MSEPMAMMRNKGTGLWTSGRTKEWEESAQKANNPVTPPYLSNGHWAAAIAIEVKDFLGGPKEQMGNCKLVCHFWFVPGRNLKTPTE
jgi:hypothetical protein